MSQRTPLYVSTHERNDTGAITSGSAHKGPRSRPSVFAFRHFRFFGFFPKMGFFRENDDTLRDRWRFVARVFFFGACSNMEYLQVWLLIVAFLRVVGAVNGAFFLKNIRERVYSGNPKAGVS